MCQECCRKVVFVLPPLLDCGFLISMSRSSSSVSAACACVGCCDVDVSGAYGSCFSYPASAQRRCSRHSARCWCSCFVHTCMTVFKNVLCWISTLCVRDCGLCRSQSFERSLRKCVWQLYFGAYRFGTAEVFHGSCAEPDVAPFCRPLRGWHFLHCSRWRCSCLRSVSW